MNVLQPELEQLPRHLVRDGQSILLLRRSAAAGQNQAERQCHRSLPGTSRTLHRCAYAFLIHT